jgi:hypothetical protein
VRTAASKYSAGSEEAELVGKAEGFGREEVSKEIVSEAVTGGARG